MTAGSVAAPLGPRDSGRRTVPVRSTADATGEMR
jgi:hypothetical protein